MANEFLPGGGLLAAGNALANPNDLCSFSHVRNASRLEDKRLGALRDASEEGLRATVEEQIVKWNRGHAEQYGQEEPNNTALKGPVSSLPRIGIGLPMSKIFAT